MKTFSFRIYATCIGLGCVTAETIEEAKKKIDDGGWDDIYDNVDFDYGKLIDIEED